MQSFTFSGNNEGGIHDHSKIRLGFYSYKAKYPFNISTVYDFNQYKFKFNKFNKLFRPITVDVDKLVSMGLLGQSVPCEIA